jgi:hypothetical protein
VPTKGVVLPPEGTSFDPAVPKSARIHDCWLGGHDNYEADRKRADEIEQMYPPVRTTVRNHRKFVGRAVTWAARMRGIRDYVDLNSGLPSGQGAQAAARTAATGV